MVPARKCCDTGLLKQLINPSFCSLYFQKQITSEAHIFFPSIANFMSISEMQKKIQSGFFDFEIFAFELVALGTPFY